MTFIVHNGGKLVHGFEIENESEEGDSSGPGSGEDGYKAETGTIQPGETISFELDLRPGIHKVECFIEGHDDLGMEILLEVRPDAPKVRQERASGAGDSVSIQGFAFEPADLQVAAGTEVTWTNDDPSPHTVTGDSGEFDTGTPGSGGDVLGRRRWIGDLLLRDPPHDEGQHQGRLRAVGQETGRPGWSRWSCCSCWTC